MAAPNVMYPTAERQRKLQQVKFEPNQTLSRDLPRDTVLKSLQLRLSGSVKTTYASGTPLADTQSIFDNLIQRVDVVVNGNRVVKSVRPHLMSIQQLLVTQIAGERRASAAASAATDNFPTVDGGMVFGTTGQITTVAESITISFEMVYADPGMGRESTWLNLKGVASAEIKLTCGSFQSLQGFGNTAPVVYSDSTLVVDIITREAQDVDPRLLFADWRQTTRVVSFSGQVQSYAIELNRGNKLAGLMLFAQDGAAASGSAGAETPGKKASNLLVTNLALIVNGQTTIKATDFKALQAENRSQYGVSAPFASGVSRLDGIAHLNLLARRDLSTALSVEPPAVDNLQLVIDTNTGSNVSYTNPASLTIMSEEIVYPR